MFALYYPSDDRYSKTMTLREAKKLMQLFEEAILVDARTAIALYSGYDNYAPFDQEEMWDCGLEYKYLMWLDELSGENVVDDDGIVYGGNFAIDRFNKVYEYEENMGAFMRCPKLRTCDTLGREIEFDMESDWVEKELAEI